MPPHSLKKKAFIQIVSVFLAQPPPKNLNLFVNDGILGGKKRTARTKKKKNPKYFKVYSSHEPFILHFKLQYICRISKLGLFFAVSNIIFQSQCLLLWKKIKIFLSRYVGRIFFAGTPQHFFRTFSG